MTKNPNKTFVFSKSKAALLKELVEKYPVPEKKPDTKKGA